MPKRKPITPRKARVAKPKVHEIWVQPKGRFRWRLELDGEVLGYMRKKDDATAIGRLLANLLGREGPTELYVCLRDGTIEDKSTFPSAADPRASKG